MATLFAAQCQNCNFSQRIVGKSDYAYRLSSPPDVFMWVQLAWCSACQEVVQAEKLLSDAEIEERIDGSQNRRIRQDAERYRQMMQDRQSPARCLNCGSDSIIAASSDWQERFLPHLTCGGIISLTQSGFVRSGQTEIYSPEGEHLAAIDGILIPGRGY